MAALPIDDPFVTVEEYLHTVYEPECDYVDGRLEDRNVGEHDHGFLQALLAAVFLNNRQSWGVYAVTEVRTQVKQTHYRCPDVLVVRPGTPREQILTRPPLIAIEILSPEDRVSRMQVKFDDYIQFGIKNIWVVDPETRRAWTVDRFGMHLVESGELTVPETPIRVVLSELFAELDRA